MDLVDFSEDKFNAIKKKLQIWQQSDYKGRTSPLFLLVL